MTEVVAALIWENGKFMICQRPAHKARGLLWEFGITVAVGDVFTEVTHVYPDLTVHLTLLNARIADGEPQLLEHNDLRWITPREIDSYDFCPADEVILARIKAAYRLDRFDESKRVRRNTYGKK